MQQPQMQQSQWSTGTQPPPRYGTQPYVPQIQQRYPTQPDHLFIWRANRLSRRRKAGRSCR